MRIQSLLLLAVAMICGTVLMFIAGLVWFPLKSTTISKEVPKSQVLVAKKDIPAGTKIHGELVEYRFVPVRSIPVGATTDFHRIYNRKAIYPIAKGTPICDLDLDTPLSEEANEKMKVPFGMNVVQIQVDRIQTTSATDTFAETPAIGSGPSSAGAIPSSGINAEVLAKAVQPGDTVDLMLLETAQKVEVPANRSPFGLSDRRRSDSSKKDTIYRRKPTQLIASGLKVYAFSEKTASKDVNASFDETSSEIATATGPQPVISLLMSKDQLEEVKRAAKLGRLQIVLHSQNENENLDEKMNENENLNEQIKEETHLPQASPRSRMILQASSSVLTSRNRSRSSGIEPAVYNEERREDGGMRHEADASAPSTDLEIVEGFDSSKSNDSTHSVELPTLISAPNDAFSEVAVESVVEPITEPVCEIPAEPAEEPITQPVCETSNEPTEEPITEPVCETPNEPAEESITQPVCETSNEPAEESITEPVCETPNEPAEEPITQPVCETPNEPAEEPITQPVCETPNEPAEEPITEPVCETPNEPAEEPITEPVCETPNEPAEEPITQPVCVTPEKSIEEPEVDITVPLTDTEDKGQSRDHRSRLAIPGSNINSTSQSPIPNPQHRTSPTLAPPLPKRVVKTTTQPTLAPPFPQIEDRELGIGNREPIQSQRPTLKSSGFQPPASGHKKQQQVVKIGLTPLKRRTARLDRTGTIPQRAMKSMVKPEQVPPNDYLTREYDPNLEQGTSQEVVRIVSFARKNGKKTDLYPHYFYEPTSLLLSPDRIAIKEEQLKSRRK